jgi:hypothetical protein
MMRMAVAESFEEARVRWESHAATLLVGSKME